MKRLLSLLLVLVMVLTLVPRQALAAEGAAVTVSGNYSGKYVVIAGEAGSDLYYIGSGGTVQNADGSAAAFAPGTYTVYYGINAVSGRGAQSSFASGTFTVDTGDTAASVTLRSAWVRNSSADVRLYATSLFHNTAVFDHVDIRVAGSYVIHVGSQAYEATVSNPSVAVKVGGSTVASQTWTGTTSYEWRQTGLRLTRADGISVELVLDLSYTDSSGQRHTLEDVQITYDSVNNIDRFIDAIAICDMVQGLDFRVSVEDIEEEIQYHAVSYEWKVLGTDGTYTQLPAGAPREPASTSGHAAGEQYVYDTEYVSGTSFYDYDAGLLYTFHGWDTYSHSATYNPIPSTGYYALDDGDSLAANNAPIEITADTYIYGYWTVTELAPASAHIAIEKVFLVDGVEMTLAEAQELWFRIDTGIDRDGDGDTEIDVDYPMIAATGEYKIPVYQYDTPFVFTEQNADVPGYTRTTTVTVAGDHIVSSTQSGDSVSVTMDPVYQGENIHLGTVTYTNSYTRNVGDSVFVYPTLTLLKTAADTHLAQDGVAFTLYSDAACTNAVASVTTAGGGLGYLDFASLENAAPGTYYLKETAPLSGYMAEPCAYAITLAMNEPLEELRWNETAGRYEYVPVTYYTLGVAVPEGSDAVYSESRAAHIYYRLHIYNKPIPVSLHVEKLWDDGGYHARPEAVEVTLYRDNEAYDTVTLSEANDWRYSWEALDGMYDWSVDEAAVPEGYSKTVANEGSNWTITNTREYSYIDVSVTKVWYGAEVEHPDSVSVTLYRNGEAYDTVTLSEDNGWSYIWKDLTDACQWEVDEPSVPSGYNKAVRQNGYSFTITNTYEDIPKTGGVSGLLGFGAMTGVGIVGFGASALALLLPRKKKEEEE